MKLAERPRSYTNIPLKNLDVFHKMNTPPVFDIDAAERARMSVRKNLPEKGQFTALSQAISLATYNYIVSEKPTDEQIQAYLNRFGNLRRNEATAANPSNPLPPIGWEIEVGRIGLENVRRIDPNNTLSYPQIFKILRVTNGFNSLVPDPQSMEFSPFPAYSASVAARMLSEMIKGGFIPSLRKSQDPQDIKKYLAAKLVSLHVNLGLPHTADPQISLNSIDARNFSAAFAFAFTSPQRLGAKLSSHLYSVKKGPYEMQVLDKTAVDVGRFEIKCLEVRDESVYRLLEEAQLWGAAFFSHYGTPSSPELMQEWNTISYELSDLFSRLHISETDLTSKQRMFSLAKNKIVDKRFMDFLEWNEKADSTRPNSLPLPVFLRQYITQHARNIRRIIQDTQAHAA